MGYVAPLVSTPKVKLTYPDNPNNPSEAHK